MTILKALRFMYRDALNGRIILIACWRPAVNGDLGDDTIIETNYTFTCF